MLSAFNDELAQAKTWKEVFLAQMGRLICGMKFRIIRPHCYSVKRGNKPFDLMLMIRILIL
jgi:hypothetical protein